MLLPLFYKLPELTVQVQSTYSPILDTHSPLALLVWLVCIAFASPYTTLCSCYLAVVLVAAKLHCGWNSVWCVPTAVLQYTISHFRRPIDQRLLTMKLSSPHPEVLKYVRMPGGSADNLTQVG